MNSSSHYFDNLPIHPSPERFESLTGFTTYLGEVNDIRTVAALSSILFPEHDPDTIRIMADYPLLSYGLLSTSGLYVENALYGMTFYYLSGLLQKSVSN